MRLQQRVKYPVFDAAYVGKYVNLAWHIIFSYKLGLLLFYVLFSIISMVLKAFAFTFRSYSLWYDLAIFLFIIGLEGTKLNYGKIAERNIVLGALFAFISVTTLGGYLYNRNWQTYVLSTDITLNTIQIVMNSFELVLTMLRIAMGANNVLP